MGDLNYQREAARDKRASAQQRELELAKSAGELVEVAAVQHRIADHARAALDFLAARRRRLAPTLALESDPRKVEALLEQSDREFAAAVSRLGTAMDNEAQAA
jgi:phage terminase Nu1 subunit (DNA packaging protein)